MGRRLLHAHGADGPVDVGRVGHERRHHHLHARPEAARDLRRPAAVHGHDADDAHDDAEGAQREQRVQRDVLGDGALAQVDDRPRDDDQHDVQ